MGLDVGVVSIEYLDRPRGVVNDFASSLIDDVGDSGWTVVVEGNAFVQLTRDTMEDLARERQETQNLSPDDVAAIRQWMDALPWQNGVMMLYFSW